MTVFAFACLGFLIGNLLGLSAESALSVVLPLLFAFGGGFIAFLHKLEPADRRLAAGAVAALALSCLLGAYVGIAASEYQLLTPGTDRAESRAAVAERKYLRTVDFDDVQTIDQRYKTNELTADRAYEELYRLVSEGNAE